MLGITNTKFICQTPCEHTDCAELKHFIKNATCKICKKSIKSGDAYYGTKLDDLEHWTCAIDEAEKRRNL